MLRRVILVAVLAGCVEQGPLLVLSGAGCAEVGLTVPLDPDAVRSRLPEGFVPLPAGDVDGTLPAGSAPAVVAVNRCAFRVGPAEATEAEVFVWVAVQPPPHLRLANGSHAFEVHRWRPEGAVLEELRPHFPGHAPARLAGADAGLGPGALQVTVQPGEGGALELTGEAAPPQRVLDHPEGACCRTFARGRSGLVMVEYTSTDQPFGEARCTLRTSHASLAALLGAEAWEGRCLRNGPYDFVAEVRPAR